MLTSSRVLQPEPVSVLCVHARGICRRDTPFRLSEDGTALEGALSDYLSHDEKTGDYKTESERVRFVCLPIEVLRVTFRFNLTSNIENDLGIEIETVLIVSATTFPLVPISPPQEPKHMEIRKMVLNALERRERVYGM